MPGIGYRFCRNHEVRRAEKACRIIAQTPLGYCPNPVGLPAEPLTFYCGTHFFVSFGTDFDEIILRSSFYIPIFFVSLHPK